MGYNVTFSSTAPISVTVGSNANYAMTAYPLVRENVTGNLREAEGNASSSRSRLGLSERNIPAAAKSLKYNGSLEGVCFTLSLELWLGIMGGQMTTACWLLLYQLRGQHSSSSISLVTGWKLTFPEKASRFEQRFDKRTLRAASQMEFYSMA